MSNEEKKRAKTKISFKLKEKAESFETKDDENKDNIIQSDENITENLKSLKLKYDKLEKTLKEREENIIALQEEAKEHLELIKEIQKKYKAPKQEDKVKVFEKISRLGKVKGDKVKEGQRTISGILMGLSFHLYFSLYGIEKFTITALLLFSAFCFFMSVIFTFIPEEKWEHFPTYMLIMGASALVVNSNFLIMYRYEVGLATAWTDAFIIYMMFPIVLSIIGIIYLIQETYKKRQTTIKKNLNEFLNA